MGLRDLFGKKSLEEQFQEAVKEQKHIQVIKLGKELLNKYPGSTMILNPYVDALIKLGKKGEAVKTLNEYGKQKLKDGYYDSAVVILKRSWKINPKNPETAKLLASAYEKKNLNYEAFDILLKTYQMLRDEGEPTAELEEAIESFIDRHGHPVLYELYADELLKNGKENEAYEKYIAAGNMYDSMERWTDAVNAFLKARRIRKTPLLDEKIASCASLMPDQEQRDGILQFLLAENAKDPDALEAIVKEIVKKGGKELLYNVSEKLRHPVAKLASQAIADIELGEIEDALEKIDRLANLSPKMAERIRGKLLSKYPDAASYGAESTVPSEEEILSSIFSAFEEENRGQGDLSQDTQRQEIPLHLEMKPKSVSNFEIKDSVSKFSKGYSLISRAEAMFGLMRYNDALRIAKEALKYDDVRFRAVNLIASTYAARGEPEKALSFLFDALEKYSFTPEERKTIKEMIAKLYEEMGEEEKARHWYREAQKFS